MDNSNNIFFNNNNLTGKANELLGQPYDTMLGIVDRDQGKPQSRKGNKRQRKETTHNESAINDDNAIEALKEMQRYIDGGPASHSMGDIHNSNKYTPQALYSIDDSSQRYQAMNHQFSHNYQQQHIKHIDGNNNNSSNNNRNAINSNIGMHMSNDSGPISMNMMSSNNNNSNINNNNININSNMNNNINTNSNGIHMPYMVYNQHDIIVKKEIHDFNPLMDDSNNNNGNNRYLLNDKDDFTRIRNNSDISDQLVDEKDMSINSNNINGNKSIRGNVIKKPKRAIVEQCPKCSIQLGSRGALRYHILQKVCQRRYIRNTLSLENEEYNIGEIATSMANAASSMQHHDYSAHMPSGSTQPGTSPAVGMGVAAGDYTTSHTDSLGSNGIMSNNNNLNLPNSNMNDNDDDGRSSLVDNSIVRSEPCEKCGRTFTSKQGLKYHVRKGVCERRKLKDELNKQQPQLLKMNGADGVLVYIPSYLVTSHTRSEEANETLQIPLHIPGASGNGNKSNTDNSVTGTQYLTLSAPPSILSNGSGTFLSHENNFNSLSDENISSQLQRHGE